MCARVRRFFLEHDGARGAGARCVAAHWVVPARADDHCTACRVAAGKNALGLGPNVTGLALGALFFGVYFGSSYVTRVWVMAQTDSPEKPKYFRDINIVTSDDQPQGGGR